MAGHDHDHHHHDHDHEHGSELSETQLRVRALETMLTEKGYIDPAALDAIIEAYETKIGPRNGAVVVAKAWIDPAFKKALLDDATKAVASMGHMSRVGDHLVAVENTPQRHNMIVCTLCSCYPWEVLGLPPVWYKSAPYRSRAVKDPRGVLDDFGITLPKDTEVRVWDSTAETRFIVLPMRPAGTEGWSEDKLADLVTRDSMIGTGLPLIPASKAQAWTACTTWAAWTASARSSPSRTSRRSTPPWEGRVLAMQRAMGYAGAWHIDHSRFAQEKLPPLDYLGASYYQRWMLAMESNVTERGYATPEELKAGHAQTPGKYLPRKLTPDVVGARHVAQLVLPAAARPAEVQAGRPRAHQEHPSGDAHAAAALCARQGRRGRDVPRLPHVSGFGRDRPRATIRSGSIRWCSTSQELWGPDADPTIKISIDAFEPYLEPA